MGNSSSLSQTDQVLEGYYEHDITFFVTVFGSKYHTNEFITHPQYIEHNQHPLFGSFIIAPMMTPISKHISNEGLNDWYKRDSSPIRKKFKRNERIDPQMTTDTFSIDITQFEQSLSPNEFDTLTKHITKVNFFRAAILPHFAYNITPTIYHLLKDEACGKTDASFTHVKNTLYKRILPFYGLNTERSILPPTPNTYVPSNNQLSRHILNQYETNTLVRILPTPRLVQIGATYGYNFAPLLHLPFINNVPAHHIGTVLLLDLLDPFCSDILSNFITSTHDFMLKGCLFNLYDVPIHIIKINHEKLDQLPLDNTLSDRSISLLLENNGFDSNCITFHHHEPAPGFESRQPKLYFPFNYQSEGIRAKPQCYWLNKDNYDGYHDHIRTPLESSSFIYDQANLDPIEAQYKRICKGQNDIELDRFEKMLKEQRVGSPMLSRASSSQFFDIFWNEYIIPKYMDLYMNGELPGMTKHNQNNTSIQLIDPKVWPHNYYVGATISALFQNLNLKKIHLNILRLNFENIWKKVFFPQPHHYNANIIFKSTIQNYIQFLQTRHVDMFSVFHKLAESHLNRVDNKHPAAGDGVDNNRDNDNDDDDDDNDNSTDNNNGLNNSHHYTLPSLNDKCSNLINSNSELKKCHSPTCTICNFDSFYISEIQHRFSATKKFHSIDPKPYPMSPYLSSLYTGGIKYPDRYRYQPQIDAASIEKFISNSTNDDTIINNSVYNNNVPILPTSHFEFDSFITIDSKAIISQSIPSNCYTPYLPVNLAASLIQNCPQKQLDQRQGGAKATNNSNNQKQTNLLSFHNSSSILPNQLNHMFSINNPPKDLVRRPDPQFVQISRLQRKHITPILQEYFNYEVTGPKIIAEYNENDLYCLGPATPAKTVSSNVPSVPRFLQDAYSFDINHNLDHKNEIIQIATTTNTNIDNHPKCITQGDDNNNNNNNNNTPPIDPYKSLAPFTFTQSITHCHSLSSHLQQIEFDIETSTIYTHNIDSCRKSHTNTNPNPNGINTTEQNTTHSSIIRANITHLIRFDNDDPDDFVSIFPSQAKNEVRWDDELSYHDDVYNNKQYVYGITILPPHNEDKNANNIENNINEDLISSHQLDYIKSYHSLGSVLKPLRHPPYFISQYHSSLSFLPLAYLCGIRIIPFYFSPPSSPTNLNSIHQLPPFPSLRSITERYVQLTASKNTTDAQKTFITPEKMVDFFPINARAYSTYGSQGASNYTKFPSPLSIGKLTTSLDIQTAPVTIDTFQLIHMDCPIHIIVVCMNQISEPHSDIPQTQKSDQTNNSAPNVPPNPSSPLSQSSQSSTSTLSGIQPTSLDQTETNLIRPLSNENHLDTISPSHYNYFQETIPLLYKDELAMVFNNPINTGGYCHQYVAKFQQLWRFHFIDLLGLSRLIRHVQEDAVRQRMWLYYRQFHSMEKM